MLPPSSDLRLPLGPGTAYESIVPESDRAAAQYILYGRATESGISYAWVLPNLTEKDIAKSDPPTAMPLRSEWVAANEKTPGQLTESAASLARVRAWLSLPSPPANLQFPYRLTLRNVAAGQPLHSGDMVGGQQFKLWMEAPEPAAAPVQKCWVYVFEMDREGKATLLFPAKGEGNVSNRLPLTDNIAGAAFSLTTAPWDIRVSAPFGADTFFLLVSEEALPNPDVLDFAAVYSGARGGNSSPLGRLLRNVGSGTRGEPGPVPLNWFLERQTFRSVPKVP
jgi:hypothetical protein